MNEIDWDNICTQARKLPAVVADELAARDETIGALRAEVRQLRGELAFVRRQLEIERQRAADCSVIVLELEDEAERQ